MCQRDPGRRTQAHSGPLTPARVGPISARLSDPVSLPLGPLHTPSPRLRILSSPPASTGLGVSIQQFTSVGLSAGASMSEPYTAIQVVMMPKDTNPHGSIKGAYTGVVGNISETPGVYPVTAYFYGRFSSGKQKEGTSQERQVELAKEWC